VVALLLTLAAACSAEQRDPVGLEDPPDNPGTGGGGGGGGAADEAFVGEWENIVIIQAGGDLQTTTTRWRFDADGECVQTYVLESALDGVLDLRVEPCTWDNDGLLLELTVTIVDDGSVLTFDYEFPGVDGQTLVLNGQEFGRLP
jgi:hypothetical protein